MKKFILLLAFISQYSFADSVPLKTIKDDQSCIYNTILKYWDFHKNTIMLTDKDLVTDDKELNQFPLVVQSTHTQFYCKRTILSQDTILYINKESSEPWSNIKAYWFVFKSDVSSLENQPHLYQKHYKAGDFDVFEFHMDYPL